MKDMTRRRWRLRLQHLPDIGVGEAMESGVSEIHFNSRSATANRSDRIRFSKMPSPFCHEGKSESLSECGYVGFLI